MKKTIPNTNNFFGTLLQGPYLFMYEYVYLQVLSAHLVLDQITLNLIYLIYWLKLRFACNCRCVDCCRLSQNISYIIIDCEQPFFGVRCCYFRPYSYCSSDIFALNTRTVSTGMLCEQLTVCTYVLYVAPLNLVNFYSRCCFFVILCFWLKKYRYQFRGHFVTVPCVFTFQVYMYACVYAYSCSLFVCALPSPRTPLPPDACSDLRFYWR